MNTPDQLFERVERLLVRYQELERTNVLLQDQLRQAFQERDTAQSRLQVAATRLDVLIDQLQQDRDF